MTAPAAAMRPVDDAERVELFDVLRGVALLGILLVNFWGDEGSRFPRLDEFVSSSLDILVASSFYPLYSFLFGLGFAVQLQRAPYRGSPVIRLYVRRLLALFLIGIVHAVFIWDGDILIPYAMFGFLLIPLNRVGHRWLLGAAFVILAIRVIPSSIRPYIEGLGSDPEYRESAEGVRGNRTAELDRAARRQTDQQGATRLDAYRAEVRANWAGTQDNVRGRLHLAMPISDIFAAFLIGLAVGARRWLHDAARHRRALLAWAAVAGVLSVTGTVIVYTLDVPTLASRLCYAAQDYGTTVTYVSLLSFAFVSWPRVAAGLRIFAPPGRAGLTNYLLQSVVMTLLFNQYGLRLPEPSTTGWLLLNVAFFFGVQVTVSRWWMARYRFGPAEWVWRSLTYGAPQPFRRASRLPRDSAPRRA